MDQKKIRDTEWDNLGKPRTLKGNRKTGNTLFIEEYIRENIQKRWEGYVPIKVLTADFRAWCLARKWMPSDGGTSALGRAIRRAEPDLCRTYKEIDGKGVWVYQNIVLEPRWRRGEG